MNLNQITNQNLLDEIQIWENEIGNNPKLIEVALFRVYVRFERFLYEAFEGYAIGKTSKYNFCPQRILEFQDESHFEKIFNFKNMTYLDFDLGKIKLISPHIFKNNQNPFEKTYNDELFPKQYNEIKCIRNYLAHLSSKSQKAYKESVLGAYNIVPNTIEPYEFLTKKPRSSQETYYNIYINSLKNHSELILNPIF